MSRGCEVTQLLLLMFISLSTVTILPRVSRNNTKERTGQAQVDREFHLLPHRVTIRESKASPGSEGVILGSAQSIATQWPLLVARSWMARWLENGRYGFAEAYRLAEECRLRKMGISKEELTQGTKREAHDREEWDARTEPSTEELPESHSDAECGSVSVESASSVDSTESSRAVDAQERAKMEDGTRGVIHLVNATNSGGDKNSSIATARDAGLTSEQYLAVSYTVLWKRKTPRNELMNISEI
ncbi:hypothetical protein FOZ60_016810 [Perkinsus olseni]|uniref:Uncharacterized protein n=1 Tax=Perkinsus olseni TaxID=32597 RepID=A0A7J6P424_PEROL|nr:hypothetical protein FOZ60_016810 [Perkinsus olseni]